MTKFNYKIIIGSTEISPEAMALLHEVRIVDQAGIVGDILNISFDDSKEILELPRTGVKVRVDFGYEDQVAPFGTYTIDEVSVTSRGILQVSGKGFDSHDAKLKTVKSRNFTVKTLGEVFSKVASESGMTLRMQKALFDLPVTDVYQMNESGFALLQRLSSENELTLKINGQYLAVTRIGAKETASGKKLHPIPVQKSEVSEWKYQQQKRTTHTAHKSRWADYKFMKIESTGSDSAILSSDGSETQTIPLLALSKEEAKRKANAKQQKSEQLEFTMSITMAGNRDFIAECPVVLTGFRKGIDGFWIIERAEHSLSKSGYKTEIHLYKDRS